MGSIHLEAEQSPKHLSFLTNPSLPHSLWDPRVLHPSPTSCVKPAPKGGCELATWVEDLSTWCAQSAKLSLLLKGQMTFMSVSAFFRIGSVLRQGQLDHCPGAVLHWPENTTEIHLDDGAY